MIDTLFSNKVVKVPVNINTFFSHSVLCRKYNLYLDKEKQLVLEIDDLGENKSCYTVEVVADIYNYATLYHSNHYYYFLLIEDLEEEEGGRRIYVRSV